MNHQFKLISLQEITEQAENSAVTEIETDKLYPMGCPFVVHGLARYSNRESICKSFASHSSQNHVKKEENALGIGYSDKPDPFT